MKLFLQGFSALFLFIMLSACGSSDEDVQNPPVTIEVDKKSPTVPMNLSSIPSETFIKLSWDSSTDNVGVNGYKLYKDNTFLIQTSSTSYTDTNVVIGQSYSYKVLAIDNSANESEFSMETLVSLISGEDFIENYGANAFYKTYYGTLTVTPNKDGTSTVSTSEVRFTDEYLDKEFVAFRINYNPLEESPTQEYYPNILSSRYSKVIEVIDANTLVVDLAYNGGDRDNPKVSNNASGYFFFDNRQAFIDAIVSPDRNEQITLQAGKTYVTKFAWNVITPSNIQIKTQDAYGGVKARIKLSAEDMLGGDVTKERWFNLNDDDFDIKFKNIDLVGSHYAVPDISGGSYSSGYFGGNKSYVQSARVLELYGSDDWSEYYELRDSNKLQYLPEGYNFVGTDFLKGGMYGGKHNGYDITDFIYLNCINTSMHFRTFSSIKATVSAGIYKRIIGESPENMSELVEQDIPENRINLVKISGEDGAFETTMQFVDDDKFPGNKKMKITGSGNWIQVSNLYWDQGSTGFTAVSKIVIDGFEVRLHNNGDWRTLTGQYGFYAIDNSQYARAFEQIPVNGEEIIIGDFDLSKSNDNKAMLTVNNEIEVWGLAIQINDKLNINGEIFTIVSKQLTTHATTYPDYIHTTVLTCDKPIPKGTTSFIIENSQAQYLLTGEHKMKFIYERDYVGHLFYDDFNLPFHYENVILKGYIRGSDKPSDINGDGIKRLYLLPKPMDNGYAKQFVNVIHIDDSPTPVMWVSSTLQERALLEGKEKSAYAVLIKGSYSKIQGMHINQEYMDKVKLVGNPDVSGARLLNPIIEGSIKAEGLRIEITNGKDINIDTLELLQTDLGTGKFSVITDGAKIHIDNFISHLSASGNGNSAAIVIHNPYTSFIQTPENAKTNLSISNGMGYVGLYAGNAPNLNYTIDIKNWTEASAGAPNVYFGLFSTDGVDDYPNFCNKIKIINMSGNSIINECP
ncbi:Chitin binding protein [hydrothermal vent metagenome]|uniref:Chitin binding protein n=1 Tax=hydrothermal vent metagenome TaxID=652676 RepID=A0A1W1BLY7_9ZZZZ